MVGMCHPTDLNKTQKSKFTTEKKWTPKSRHLICGKVNSVASMEPTKRRYQNGRDLLLS